MKKITLYIFFFTISIFGKEIPNYEKEIIIRDYFHYFINEVDKLEVEIDFKMGELILGPNVDYPHEFNGFSEYNPDYFDSPEVVYDVLGKSGFLIIRSVASDHEFSFDWDTNQFHNRGEYKFPLSTPIEMELDFGMGDTDIDLTGMEIQSLDIECGMGKATLNIDSQNSIICEKINIEAGMGEFEGIGLSQLRAEVVNIKVGLGSAEIDFSGFINHDMDIDVDVGLGDIELVLPDNANITTHVNETFLSSVEMGGLIKKGNKYVSRNWDRDRPTIVLDISVGLGSINLEISD